MQRAVELAREAVGNTSPNPPVGAVLVRDGRVVGEGRTQPPGGLHAEAEALRMAGDAARGADLYVTLEPCAHHGRTPPCADALVEAGVASVHVAAMDPAPHTAGRGVEHLREAGIPVTVDGGSSEAQQLVEAFAKHINTGLPFVVAKFAMSLDGKIAARSGDSRWISNETSRREAHRLRAEADAVMVGIGTALADDPLLTVRDAPLPARGQPLRVVVDSAGRLPASAAMLTEEGTTLLAVASAEAARAVEALGAETIAAPGVDGRTDLPQLLAELGARDVMSLLVEGGAALHGALFESGLVDKVVAFIAPVVIGGDGVPGPIGGAGAERMADALRLRDVTYTELDGDMMVVGYPARE
ncbi:MAG: bifunctional diaminohydroxyphosphoribosylaminopyrimidine deaminase/5-amino-6-(5-phosphoribosylamino)uracil reductase RibD [Chloroflexi bacterium]|nr:bifunctional diaminohydroxyphosphoribosylaminopyrimidine deaminase/5-amino-6-(5-phosphoribosylamino)uracil reductase RibD [Chloroflexota bacterium]MYK35686.1 bifunctional diaminohydroxyphosphoribosylaminopyrimidine deaminase/5-amino-6-(5-phosphoribosylamino)uracil reductase RibD [Chloroflexota bacterium]